MRNLTKNRIIKFIQDNGGYFAIIGAVSMSSSALISFFLILSVNPDFNIGSYAVSDLVSYSISRVIYSVGLIISSFAQIPTYVSLMHKFDKRESYSLLFKYMSLTSLFSIISHNILSVVPLERNILPLFLIHGISAGVHYVTGSVSLILIGIIELQKIKVTKIMAILSFIAGGLYNVVWIRYFLSLLLGLPDLLLNYTIQWFTLAVIIVWTLFHGVFLIKAKKRDLDNE